MRKLILISALLLASASAQAGQVRGLVLAAADTPAVTTADALPQPLPPVAKNDAKTDTKTDAKNDAPRQQASVPAAPAPSVPKQRSRARRYQSDEAKARRIAAKYGISW